MGTEVEKGIERTGVGGWVSGCLGCAMLVLRALSGSE